MPKPLTITEVSRLLKECLEESFSALAVQGELSGRISPNSSGHYYFSLKEGPNFLYCVCYRSDAERLPFSLKEGLQVTAYGRVSFYGPQGKLQMVVNDMTVEGLGSGDMAKRILIEKLRAKGWLDRPRKSFPRYPRRVALVTSPSGAAVRDMIESFHTRWKGCELLIAGCRVQGELAPPEIAAAIRQVNRLAIPIDAIIVGRGGGSAEDLNAFNTEVVAQAIVESRIPVLSAIGHEIDVTVADLVADERAETPSNAVTRLTPDQKEMKQQLRDQKLRLGLMLHGKLKRGQERIRFIVNRAVFVRPLDRIRRQEQRLDGIAERMRRAWERKQQTHRIRIESLAARLEAVSPLNVLSRGFSVTRSADGRVLRDASAVQPGDRITTTLAQGVIESVVHQTH